MPFEYRRDGWPLCPRCGEDELADLHNLDAGDPTAALWCYRCQWQGTVPPPDVHVLPVHDLRAHDETRDCWCQPDVTQEPDGTSALVTHHSLDGRELVEQHGVQ